MFKKSKDKEIDITSLNHILKIGKKLINISYIMIIACLVLLGTYLLKDTDQLARLTLLTDAQKQAVKENTPEIRRLVAEIQKNSNATDILTQNLVQTSLKDVPEYQDANNP